MARRSCERSGGPPRGRGHYSADGGWWWEDGLGRWFRMRPAEDRLEIESESVGGTSAAAGVAEILGGPYGTAQYRFVGRAVSDDPRWPTYVVVGATFPATRPTLDDVKAQGAWLDTMRDRLVELHATLLGEGWRPAGHGRHWWSGIYRRPCLDWDTPENAGPVQPARRTTLIR